MLVVSCGDKPPRGVMERLDVMGVTHSRRRTGLVRKVLRTLGLAETMAVDVMVGVTTRGSKNADRDSEKRLEAAPVVENGQLTRGVSTRSGRKEIRVPDGRKKIRVPDGRLDAALVAEDGKLARVGGPVDGDGLVDSGELADDSELVDGLEFGFWDSIGNFNWRDAY